MSVLYCSRAKIFTNAPIFFAGNAKAGARREGAKNGSCLLLVVGIRVDFCHSQLICFACFYTSLGRFYTCRACLSSDSAVRGMQSSAWTPCVGDQQREGNVTQDGFGPVLEVPLAQQWKIFKILDVFTSKQRNFPLSGQIATG